VSGILLQDSFASAEKIFLIALGAGQTAGANIYTSESGCFSAFSDAGDGFFVKANIFHDSARADILAAEFELGFDENQKSSAWLGAGKSRGKYFANGNEGYIGDDEVNQFGDVSRV
jgi:hypothetical protein